MKEQPVVSVIIPVYNSEKYVKQCLESVLNQIFDDMEIICIDDGSTDSTKTILEDYKETDSRVKIVYQNNQFAGVARNNGLEMAKGEYVLFVDGDDFCEKSLLSLAVSKARETNSDIVVFDHYRFDEKKQSLELKHDLVQNSIPAGREIFSYKEIPEQIMSVINPVPWNKLIKRELLNKFGIRFDTLSSTNDITFSALCAVCASRIAYVPQPLIYYRVNLESSITSTKQYKLNNVIAALISTYRQSKRLSNYSKIEASVQRFIISNLRFAQQNYAGDPGSESYSSFLQEAGKIFWGLPLFYSMTKESLKNNNLWEYYSKAKQWAENTFDTTYFPEIVASLTSYPKRIGTVHKTIKTLMEQTVRPDRIVLWLAQSEFPNHEKDLPHELCSLLSDEFQIRWTENIKSYKKLVPALKEFPEAVIITFDDDLLFDQNIIKRLLAGYRERPGCIQCHRITAITYHNVDDIITTPDALKVYPLPTYLHKLSGGAGCLYPPQCLHPDVLREELFMELAPSSDDIWFWLMGALNGYKTNVVKDNIPKLNYISGTQEEALWKVNDTGEGLFFVHLKNVLKYYPLLQDILSYEQAMFNSFDAIHTLAHTDPAIEDSTARTIQQMEQEIKTLRNQVTSFSCEIDNIHASVTYRLGRVMTWFPRKVRGGLRCYREHGLQYTLWRILEHLHLKRGKEAKAPTATVLMETKPVTTRPTQKEQGKADLPKAVVKDYEYYKALPAEKYEEELKLWFERTTKQKLNLETPTTFNEKIQWMKLYDSTPLKTRLADKYLVREWVAKKIGEDYLIPLLGAWDDFDDIDFNKLPDQFVLKANHGCGWNIIVKNKALFNIEEAREKFRVWMHTNFAFKFGLELQYMNIKPKIIAEQYLENNNNDLYDYKVFCFNGKAESIMYLSERKQGLKMAFFDKKWNKLPFTYSFEQNDAEIIKPKNLNLLIRLAETLAEGFPHVRVDFYILNDGSFKFGEMTFSSASGTCKWNPPEQDRVYGDLIQLPPKSPIPERKF